MFREVERLTEKTRSYNDGLRIALSINQANLYLNGGRLQEAFDYAQKAIRLEREVRGSKGKNTANAYSVIGCVYFKTKQYSLAVKYHNKSLKILLRDPEGWKSDITTSFK